jgi:hypothetical protein
LAPEALRGFARNAVTGRRNKSFFASFFSKKEDSSFSEEKEAKRLLFLVLSGGALRAIDYCFLACGS